MDAPSRSFADEGIINYTLSLAAVKSGYMTAVPTMVSMVSVEDADSEEGYVYGYEVEARENEADEESMEISIQQTESPESESYVSEAEETIQSSQYAKTQPPRWEKGKVSSSFKSAKKKVSHFLGKVRKRGTSMSIATSTKSRSFGGKTFSGASSGVSSAGEESSQEEASVEQEERTRVSIEPVEVDEEETETETEPVPPLVEQLPPSPTERKSSDIATRTQKQESFSSTHVSETNKKETKSDQADNTHESQVTKEDRHEVPENKTSETGETEDYESIDDETAHTFEVSKVSKRTYIMTDSASIIEDSWSREEQVKNKGWFGCAMCGGPPKEEWDEYDEDGFTVQSASEEGRVADAVITIQEHANRLGLTEYELLEMIQNM